MRKKHRQPGVLLGVQSSERVLHRLPPGVTGLFSLTPQQLAPGATNPISLTLTNDGSATSGSFAFTVTFTGYSASSG